MADKARLSDRDMVKAAAVRWARDSHPGFPVLSVPSHNYHQGPVLLPNQLKVLARGNSL